MPNLPKGAATNLFTNGLLFDLHVFLSEDPEFVNFNDSGALIWTKKDLVYGKKLLNLNYYMTVCLSGVPSSCLSVQKKLFMVAHIKKC